MRDERMRLSIAGLLTEVQLVKNPCSLCLEDMMWLAERHRVLFSFTVGPKGPTAYR